MSIFMNCLKCLFFISKKFENFSFVIYMRMENRTIKMKVLREKYLKDMLRNQFLKVKNIISELEKDFIELNDVELKDRETKIKREIEKLFFKPNNITIDDMDRFEKIEMKKK